MKNRLSIIQDLLSEAEWHREQASKLEQAAELLKEDSPQVTAEENGKKALTVQMVVNAMGGKGKKARKKNIATALGVQVEELDTVMNFENGFVMGDYGWWEWKG